MPTGVYKRTEKHIKNISGENNPHWKGGQIEVICEICGEKYKRKRKNQKHHNEKCYGIWRSKNLVGKNNPAYGIKRNDLIEMNKNRTGIPLKDNTKRKMSESRIKYMSSGKMLRKDTSIELKIENELKRVNLNYQKQVALCKVRKKVDFFLPEYNVIIECDGDYWHNRPEVKKRDATLDLVWLFNNYKVFRFWEHEINESPKNCIKAVLRYIKYNRLFQNNLNIVTK